MNRWANENEKSFNFETQVDIAAFDGESLPSNSSVKKSFFKSGDNDRTANNKKTIGNWKSSDIEGAKKITTKEGKGYSVYEYNAEEVPKSKNNNSAKPNSSPAYEQNR